MSKVGTAVVQLFIWMLSFFRGFLKVLKVKMISNSQEEDNRMVSIRCNGTLLNIRLDTGADKTMFGEKDWKLIKENSNVELRRTNICIVPYGTSGNKSKLDVKGVAKVTLTAPAGAEIITEVFVMNGDAESLLGDHDVVALGFIVINKEGARETVHKHTQKKEDLNFYKDSFKDQTTIENTIHFKTNAINEDILEQDTVNKIKYEYKKQLNPICSIRHKNIEKLAKEVNENEFVDREICVGPLGYELVTPTVTIALCNCTANERKWKMQ